MPLTSKGHEIMANMQKEYGEEKGKEVFYASRNKGTITGVDSDWDKKCDAILDAISSPTDLTMPPDSKK